MKILPFDPSAHRARVLSLRRRTYENLRLGRFLWRPCEQIESLEMDCLRLVAVAGAGAEVKGYAAAYRLGQTDFRLNLLVEPESAGRGIGTKLLLAVEDDSRKRGCRTLQARVLEGLDRSLAFALSRGFEEVHRMRGVSLRAEDFSFEKWEALGSRLAAENFVATTMQSELEAGVDAVEKLARLQERSLEGWASPDPTVSPDTRTARLREMFAGVKNPAGVSIMKRGGQYVAYTSADRENMLGTAVHPEYRGRGIATCLKARDLKREIDGGTDYFETSSANPAMIAVNLKLGYRPNGLTEIRLVKYL